MKRLGEAAILSLHNSLNAHATGNVELAKQICLGDTEIDKIYLSIFSKLIKEIRDVPEERITQVSQMFLSAKNIERIGDQATNCLLYTSPSPRDRTRSRMPSSA